MKNLLKIKQLILLLSVLPLCAMDADKKVEHSKQEELNTKFWGCFVERFYYLHPNENHFEVAQSLLAQKADINTRSPEYLGFLTSLEFACSFYERGDSVSWLLERGADDTMNQGQFYDWLESTPHQKLVLACYYEDKVKPILAAAVPIPKTIVDLIVSKLYITQADVDLFQKIQSGTIEEIADLLTRKNADPNTFQRTIFDGFHTPLRRALQRDDSVVVELLLSYGADPNFYWYNKSYASRPYRALPLLVQLYKMHDATAQACDLEKLRLLLEFNADPYLKDEDNLELSFLNYANGQPELMKVYQDYKNKVKDRVHNHFLKNDNLAQIVVDYAI